MGTNAEVNHGTATVDSRRGAIGNFGFDEVLLEFVVLNHVENWFEELEENTYVEHLEQVFL